MINEELMEKWIEADHQLLDELKNLMLDGEKARIRYAHESSERMKELNKMMSNVFKGTNQFETQLNKQLAIYIRLLDKATDACAMAQQSEAAALKALAHAQLDNDRLNAQVETLQDIIKHMSGTSRAGVEINNGTKG